MAGTVLPREGLLLAVPLRDGGSGVGVLARYSRPLGLGYFFAVPPARPDDERMRALTPEGADLVCQFGDGGLQDGSWPVLGEVPGFTRERWPLPAFGQYIEIVDAALRFEFLGDELDSPTRQTRVTRQEIEHLPQIGVYGSGAVELVLTDRAGRRPA